MNILVILMQLLDAILFPVLTAMLADLVLTKLHKWLNRKD